MPPKPTAPRGEVVVYQSPDGEVRVDVRLEQETAWLSLDQLAALFGRHKSVISRHLHKVFASGELERAATVAFLQQFNARAAARSRAASRPSTSTPSSPSATASTRSAERSSASGPRAPCASTCCAASPCTRTACGAGASRACGRPARRSSCWPARCPRASLSRARARPCWTSCGVTPARGTGSSSTTRTGWSRRPIGTWRDPAPWHRPRRAA